MRITIILFLTYLLRPVPSDVQLFIQAVLVRLGTAAEQGWIERNATHWRTPSRKFLATPLCQLLLITNKKSHTGFQLVHDIGDLEWPWTA